jgi:hypothetical protein
MSTYISVLLLALALPGGGELGLSHWELSLGALACGAAGAAIAWAERSGSAGRSHRA